MKRLLPSISLIFGLLFSCQATDSNQQEAEAMQTADIQQAEQTDTIPYELVTYSDTLSARPSDPEAPTAKIAETWMIPKSKDKALNEIILTSLAGNMHMDEAGSAANNPEAVYNANKEWFFNDFKEVYAGFNELMGYDSETNMLVELNDGKWLTVSISNFSYTGGAHGNYGTYYLTIDVGNRKKLGLEDVFKPGYEAVLIPLLEKKVREYFEMEPDTPLNEFLFENKVPVTDNFGLLKDGILFDYPPYEIASYAAGEISFLVSYEEISDILAIAPPQ